MTKACLLITEQFEPMADLLVAELRRRNVPCVRWNLDCFPLGSSLTYQASSRGFTADIVSDGRTIDLDEVGSIWCRGFRPSGLPTDLGPAERVFVQTESQRALDALLTIKDVLWVNHPYRHTLANSKPAQLFAAQKVGLAIPRTLITNDPEKVRTFLTEVNGQVIFKALSQSLETDTNTALFTGVLSEREIANLDLIRLTPGVFQPLVAKDHELRITVVGDRVFSTRIGSQARDDSKIDWRRVPLDLDHRIAMPPANVVEKIHALMQHFDLVYGAFDFIVTPDGDHIFLEVNPAGQYMWVEAKTGLEITTALVDVLSRPCQN